jgi:polyhydroxybutyrate depolymerase
VLGLHALTQSYKVVPSMVGFDRGGRDHFIGVNPAGLVSNGTQYWNAAPTPSNNDIDFITALLDRLEATLCIDTARVYSTGMSNGAQMSSLLVLRSATRRPAAA